MILEKLPEGQGVIVFDGYCVLCSTTVAFLAKIDKRRKFLYTTFQSQTYKNLSDQFHVTTDSIVLLMDSRVYLQSEAVIRIIRELGFPWSVMTIIKYVPFSIREKLYQFIAKHRYKIFGKKDKCGIPEANVKNRLLH